jgi:hypothetical protein
VSVLLPSARHHKRTWTSWIDALGDRNKKRPVAACACPGLFLLLEALMFVKDRALLGGGAVTLARGELLVEEDEP